VEEATSQNDDSLSPADGSLSPADGSLSPADGSISNAESAGSTSEASASEASSDEGLNQTIGLARVLESEQVPSLDGQAFAQKLQMSSDKTGRIAALRQLAGLWQEILPAQMFKPICSEVEQLSLACIGIDSWEQIQRYNRPAVMVLTEQGAEHRIILERLVDGKADILLGAERFQVDTKDLLERWDSRALAFWRPSEIGQNIYQQGDVDSNVVWLRFQLNQVLKKVGLPLLTQTASTEFDADFSQKLFALQSQFNVTADSVVGLETYLLIEDILNTKAPQLYARVERSE
jgi:general secretion pathway protein A